MKTLVEMNVEMNTQKNRRNEPNAGELIWIYNT